MASANQIKNLIKAHFDIDEQTFKTTVLQIAAHEAKQGHSLLARQIKEIYDNNSTNKNYLA